MAVREVTVLEPYADPAALRSQGRETEARRSEAFRGDVKAIARVLDGILGLAERDRDATCRAALQWLEALRRDGYTEHDRKYATVLHVALLADGFPAEVDALMWCVEISINSQWPRERTMAMEVVERILESSDEQFRAAFKRRAKGEKRNG